MRWTRVLPLLGVCLCCALFLPNSFARDGLTDAQVQRIDRLRDLVALRSAAGQNGLVPMADRVESEFLSSGFEQQDIQRFDLDGAPSLMIRYRGSDSRQAPILFMAHMDVVDALREDWTRDPFTLIQEDGYLYGRGTMDNKAGVANLMGVFIRLRKEGYVPQRELILLLSNDEETSGAGIQKMLQEVPDLGRAEYALNSDGGGGVSAENGDSISFTIQSAEKTYMTFAVTARNPGGHSSEPRSDNAIFDLAQALRNLSEHQFPVRVNTVTKRFFERTAAFNPEPWSEYMRRFAENPKDEIAIAGLSQNPEYIGLIRTTCVPTMLNAGHAENALPQTAQATINCRVWPDESRASVLKSLQRAIANPTVKVTALDNYSPSPVSSPNPELFAALKAVVHKRHPGIPLVPYMAPYGTDGNFTRAAGIPTYGIGGVFLGPNDQRAHGLNERVPLAAFLEGEDYWYELITRLAPG